MSKSTSFRVGKVQGYIRGKVWYLCYHENGKRRRPRVGDQREEARKLAAQVNAQLEVGAPGAMSFESISFPELRRQWLEQHEQVRRSSVHTISRYRTATDHLLRFLQAHPVRSASHFHVQHAHSFVKFLRNLEVSSNGHAHTKKRPLMDKGLRFVLECCRAMFNYAAKRRHLPPYAENPFQVLEIDRIPVERSKPIQIFDVNQQKAFLDACDDWQFPLFLTLMLTGLRPGELTHLLLPDDIDLQNRLLRVRNKPTLGWQVKTRNEREIPLVPVLADVLSHHLSGRQTGPAFLRRLCHRKQLLVGTSHEMELALNRRIAECEKERSGKLNRRESGQMAQGVWRDTGVVDEGQVRLEFMKITKSIGIPSCTAPKVLRHLFATTLQEGRVDPLIRNELMGHVAPGDRMAGHGLVPRPV